MSRFPDVLAAAVGVLAASAPAWAQAVLDVSGSVVAVAPRLEVRVEIANRGDRPATPLDVSGELLGERREARLATGVPPGGTGAVRLDFAAAGGRPGVHALTLLLEHPVDGTPDAAGNPPVASQRAWLLLALGGASPEEAVHLAAEPLALDVKGGLAVRAESADGRPHPVRLRVLTARGLRAEGEAVEVAVPASGSATARLPLVRAGAPRGSRHAVLVVAEALDGPLARTTVLAAPVDLAPDSLPPAPAARAALRPRPGPRRGGAPLRGLAPTPHLTLLPTPTYGVSRMEKPKDYYQLLGVPRDASLTAIKRAFKRLARRFEPARAGAALDAFAELQAAYETLTDAEQRRRYDDELGGEDRGAAVDWSLVRRPAAGDLRRPFAPTSLTAELLVRPEEAAAGTVLSIDVPVTATCDACGGTGGASSTAAAARAKGRWPGVSRSRCTSRRGCATGSSSRCGPTTRPCRPSC